MVRAALVAVTTMAAVASLAGEATQQLPQRLSTFTQYLEPLRVQAGIPGLSAAIVSNGDIVWDGGFGYADAERKIAADPTTPYPVASITKTFASTLLMQCVDAGRLRLDDPMSRYGVSVPDSSATVRQVLAMASDSPSGSRYRYDGNRFDSLTAVVDACAAAPFRIALARLVLDRLAMVDSVPGHDLESPGAQSDLFDATTLSRYRAVLARMAKPYVSNNGRPAASEYPPRGISAAAGLISTVRDLAKFDLAINRGILSTQSSQSVAWTNFRLSNGAESPYALGWFAQSTAAGRVIWHYGSWPTFSSLLLKIPSRDLTLILLANSDGLSTRFPLADGDVTTSPFARAFIAAAQP
jgi:CubicO group peptidase (beta-lactamase class C family)